MELLELGYDESRFTNTVDEDLHCAICLNVLNEPVQCRSNEHHFCSCCIRKHLENYDTCPSCMEELTCETLKKPSRFLIRSLSELTIRCAHENRGCSEKVLLSNLKAHLARCEFAPVKCENEGCPKILNKREKEYHEIQVCKYRKSNCTDCRKTSEDIDEIKRSLEQQSQVLSQVLARMDLLTQVSYASQSGFKVGGDVIIAGGRMGKGRFNSILAEMFSWSTRTWVRVQPMREYRSGASSVVYENKMIISGGRCSETNNSATLVSLEFEKKAAKWFGFPATLPIKVTTHNSVVYKDRLFVIGGCDNNGDVLNSIYRVLLISPYSSELVCHMPYPVCFHGAERFGKEVFIIGGCMLSDYRKPTNNVVKYDLESNECFIAQALPYPVGGASTVSWKNEIIVIGGAYGKASNKVLSYNIETEVCDMLPNMKYRRRGSAAVVSGNKIVVMGGTNEDSEYLNTVESFCCDGNYSCWEVLQPMTQPRSYATAVVACCSFV